MSVTTAGMKPERRHTGGEPTHGARVMNAPHASLSETFPSRRRSTAQVEVQHPIRVVEQLHGIADRPVHGVQQWPWSAVGALSVNPERRKWQVVDVDLGLTGLRVNRHRRRRGPRPVEQAPVIRGEVKGWPTKLL